MTPQELSRLKSLVLLGDPHHAHEAAVELGQRLKDEFCSRAQLFRDIAHVVSSAGRNGNVPSPYIQLAPDDDPDPRIGHVLNFASVAIREFNPHKKDVSFRVTTTFSSRGVSGLAVPVRHEVFGGAFKYLDAEPPAFVINPNTGCDTPWYPGTATFRHPMNHLWTPDAYQTVRTDIEDMLAHAAGTQAMLLEAMQDDTLNPGFAEDARRLALPSFQA